MAEYNCYLVGNTGYLPLDWHVVRAMVWVEVGTDSEAQATRSMQTGNPDDPISDTSLRGEGGNDLTVPSAIRTRLNTGLARAVPARNIRAGVGYLFTCIAELDVWSVHDANDKVYEAAVKAGDGFSKITRVQGVTLAGMHAFNLNTTTFKSGWVVKYRKAAMCKVITGWRPVATQSIAALYNHGDVAYIQKLDYVLTLIPKIGTVAYK